MPQGGQIKILSDDQIEQIHLSALSILCYIQLFAHITLLLGNVKDLFSNYAFRPAIHVENGVVQSFILVNKYSL